MKRVLLELSVILITLLLPMATIASNLINNKKYEGKLGCIACHQQTMQQEHASHKTSELILPQKKSA